MNRYKYALLHTLVFLVTCRQKRVRLTRSRKPTRFEEKMPKLQERERLPSTRISTGIS